MWTIRPAALAPLVLLWAVGCNSGPTIVSVKGTATRGGQPLKKLLVTFNPEGEGAHSSWGVTDEQGHFTLTYDKDNKGASLGKHKVTAVFAPRGSKEEFEFIEGKLQFHPDQNLINEKYGKLETTPLTIEVTKAGQVIELKLD